MWILQWSLHDHFLQVILEGMPKIRREREFPKIVMKARDSLTVFRNHREISGFHNHFSKNGRGMFFYFLYFPNFCF